MSDGTYAGDVSPENAWATLTSDAKAALVDVRTQPEWVFVGVPDLASTEKQPLLVQWQVYPSMQKNRDFVDQVRNAGVAEDDRLYFICRSGKRSMHAAVAMTAAGFKKCFNVAGGFEGDLDSGKHRGTTGGWKVAGLPWMQE